MEKLDILYLYKLEEQYEVEDIYFSCKEAIEDFFKQQPPTNHRNLTKVTCYGGYVIIDDVFRHCKYRDVQVCVYK